MHQETNIGVWLSIRRRKGEIELISFVSLREAKVQSCHVSRCSAMQAPVESSQLWDSLLLVLYCWISWVGASHNVYMPLSCGSQSWKDVEGFDWRIGMSWSGGPTWVPYRLPRSNGAPHARCSILPFPCRVSCPCALMETHRQTGKNRAIWTPERQTAQDVFRPRIKGTEPLKRISAQDRHHRHLRSRCASPRPRQASSPSMLH